MEKNSVCTYVSQIISITCWKGSNFYGELITSEINRLIVMSIKINIKSNEVTGVIESNYLTYVKYNCHKYFKLKNAVQLLNLAGKSAVLVCQPNISIKNMNLCFLICRKVKVITLHIKSKPKHKTNK